MGFNGTIKFGSSNVPGKYHHLAEVVMSAHGQDAPSGSFVVEVYDSEQAFHDGEPPLRSTPATALSEDAVQSVRNAAAALVYAEAMAGVPDAVEQNDNPDPVVVD